MTNSMKTTGGDSLALQVTHAVRKAKLVEEIGDEDNPLPYTYRADVRIHAFDGLLLIVDRGRVSNANQAELVAHAIEETESVGSALDVIVSVMGEGYMLQLPNAEEAGFKEGQPAPVQTAPSILVIHEQSDEATEVANELVEIRHDQLNN